MSYTPTVWKSGDVVTSAKLNKLENGVAAAGGGSVEIIHATVDYEHAESETEFPLIIDKTAEEIAAAETTILIVNEDGTSFTLNPTQAFDGEGSWARYYEGTMEGTRLIAGIVYSDNTLEAFVSIAPSNTLPSVSASDNGKILKVDDGAWGAVDNTFVITCTPTAQDMSGTMDKTPAEIKAAYEVGAEIRVRVVTAENRFSEIIPESLNVTTADGEVSYVIVAATFVYQPSAGVNYLVQAVTSGVDSTYSTSIFALTHPSP